MFLLYGYKKKSRILSNKGISNGRDEVFEPEDDLFKEMAMKEEQEDKQEEEQDVEFDDMFRLPLEYTFLEKIYGITILWNLIN